MQPHFVRSRYYKTIYLLEIPGEGVFPIQADQPSGVSRAVAGLPGVDADPLLRSALALAGFNTWLGGGDLPPEAGNGLLTADEVCALDLDGTRIVVLSACDTGLGLRQPVEGVIGLRWAFQVAGARAVVASLWPVPDAATNDLMAAFYSRLADGTPVPEALRTAQARHPPAIP